MKIKRSRSSRTGPSSAVSSGPLLAFSSAAWAYRSSREASRRRRSIARLRAMVMIQPAGLGGRRLFDGFTASFELQHLGVRQSAHATFIDYAVRTG